MRLCTKNAPSTLAPLLCLLLCTSCDGGLVSFEVSDELETQKIAKEMSTLRGLFAQKNANATQRPLEVVTFLEGKSLGGEVSAVRLNEVILYTVDGAQYATAKPAAGQMNAPPGTAIANSTEAQTFNTRLQTLLGGKGGSWIDTIATVFGRGGQSATPLSTCPGGSYQNFDFMEFMEISVEGPTGSNLPPVVIATYTKTESCRAAISLAVNNDINLATYYRVGMVLKTKTITGNVVQDVYFRGKLTYRVELL